MQKHLIKSIFIPAILSATALSSKAQQADTLPVIQLDSVVVKAFEQNRGWKEVPAAVSYIGPATLQRFTPVSVVSAINTAAGIRMEERSPGSYRFNIRGSSLRSPFGVRNVKVYYNDIPFTDPGGQTYLNNLGSYNYGSVEIIKGPGSSLYGTGTGGVLLIDGLQRTANSHYTAEYTLGSFDLNQFYAAANIANGNHQNLISFQQQQSDGYRQHSELKRTVATWNGRFSLDEKKTLQTTILFSDLYYQTPGALTLAEFEANPKGSRPAGGGFPSAEAAKAAIYQKMFVAGISYSQSLTEKLQNKTVAYGAFTQLKNPAIRNYGIVNEPHGGTRTLFTFQQNFDQAKLKLDAGAEWQQGISTVNIHQNKSGNSDSLQTADDIVNRQAFAFAQATLDYKRWLFTAGASI
ncbi:MAG: TonB-dependent receptor, partial [Chitinophagaceae bacterium]